MLGLGRDYCALFCLFVLCYASVRAESNLFIPDSIHSFSIYSRLLRYFNYTIELNISIYPQIKLFN